MKLRSKTFITFIVLAIIYASVNLIAAPPRTYLEHYHVTSATMRLLDSTVVLPVIIIWFIGLYGYQKLRAYTTYIGHNKEGEDLVRLTRGIMILAWWLPIATTISALLDLFARQHPSFLPTATIIIDYMSMLFPLVAFWLISRGSRRLSEISGERPSQNSVHIMAILLIAGSILYTCLVVSSRDQLWSIHHLPLWAILTTLALPYIFTWYLGMMAAFDMRVYSSNVKGILFRRSWSYLAVGIVWIIIMSILLQYVTAVSTKLGDMSLGWALALTYGVLVTLAIGYVFIALGAKKLTKIEEA